VSYWPRLLKSRGLVFFPRSRRPIPFFPYPLLSEGGFSCLVFTAGRPPPTARTSFFQTTSHFVLIVSPTFFLAHILSSVPPERTGQVESAFSRMEFFIRCDRILSKIPWGSGRLRPQAARIEAWYLQGLPFSFYRHFKFQVL